MDEFDSAFRSSIIGCVVKDIRTVHNTYVLEDRTIEGSCPCLVFDRGHLEMDNPFLLHLDGGTTHSSAAEIRPNIQKLIGRRVVNVARNADALAVAFDGGASVVISLLEHDFTTPEGASFHAPGGRHFVFNQRADAS